MIAQSLTGLQRLLSAVVFDVIQPVVDFALGRVINPLLVGIFAVIFVVSWSFFLGLIAVGFVALAWRLKGEFPAWLRRRWMEGSCGGGGGGGSGASVGGGEERAREKRAAAEADRRVAAGEVRGDARRRS